MFNSAGKQALGPVDLPLSDQRSQERMNASGRSRAPASSFEFGLFDIIAALWKRKWLMILLPLACAIGAAAYAMSLPNLYLATAQILIDPRELRVLDRDVVPQGFANDAAVSFLESQVRVIGSTDMLRRIVAQEKLVDDPEFNKPPNFLDRLIGLDTVPMDKSLKTAAELAKKLTVRRDERTFVIEIWVETEGAEKSAKLANAFVAAYLADQVAARGNVAARTSSTLTGRLDELQTRVRTAEDKVEAYRRERGIVDANGRLVTDEQLANVNTQLSAANARVADAKSKLDQIAAVGASAMASLTLPEAISSPSLGILRQQLGDADRLAANLATTLGARHPDYLAALAVKREAERGVRDELTRIRAGAKAEFDRATSSKTALSAQLETLKSATLNTSADTVKLRELQREVEASRSLYQASLQRSLEAGEQAGIDSTNTRVIAQAVAPFERNGPKRRLIVTLAGLAGAVLASMIALALEIMARYKAFRAAEQVEMEAPLATASLRQTNVLPPPNAYPSPTPYSGYEAANDRTADWSRAAQREFSPERQTYTELLRLVRQIEDIEQALKQRRRA
jgi:uncharacterized protein involved in exopolysaccharide biosynthesis